MTDQVVIITGAGNGIGLATVQGLLASSHISHVIAVDLNVAKLETLSQEEKYRGKLHPVSGDVSRSSTSKAAVEAAIKYGGHINSLILNAAIVKPIGPFPTLAIDDWKKTFDVNFFALLDMIQQAWPHLLETEGNVMMTSSRVSLAPTESWTCYASTKSAMNYVCSCLPLEEPRIKYVAITPGAVDTESMTNARNDKNMSSAMSKFMNGISDGNNLLRPEQPASAFVKLAETGIPQSMTGSTVYWASVVEAEQ